MKAYVVDAFCREGKGGNPAGVVLLNTELEPSIMQSTANKLGFSETAFVLTKGKWAHQIRYFTPTKEVNLCGHATIASYALLGSLGHIQAGLFSLETLAGPQRIEYSEDHLVKMTQNLPQFGQALSAEEVAPCLGLAPKDLKTKLPIQVASTGLHKIFVPVASVQKLMEIQPDLQEIERVSLRYGAIGMYCYSLFPAQNVTAHCRNFAPVVGIQEDAATGTSAAALSCVLQHFQALPQNQPKHHLVYEQGDCIGRPSTLVVFLQCKNNSVTQVSVAGKATIRETIDLENNR